MNNLEEKLWNYIDGTCTPDEQKSIGVLIAADEAVRLKYQELLKLNADFAVMELDEPPMAFTYNVIEAIRTEQAQVPLKATVNKKIISGITIFFGFTILASLVFTFMNISWPSISSSPAPALNIHMPNLSHYFTKPVIEGFIFFDVILAMFLADSYLRKKTLSGTGE